MQRLHDTARSRTAANVRPLSFAEESPRAVQRIQFAHIEQAQVLLRMGLYLHLGAYAEVEIHYRKAAREILHIRGYLRGDTMDTREGKVLLGLGMEVGEGRFDLPRRHILPTAQAKLFVEEEVARALATAHH